MNILYQRLYHKRLDKKERGKGGEKKAQRHPSDPFAMCFPSAFKRRTCSIGRISGTPTPDYPTDRPGGFSTIAICSGNGMHAAGMLVTK